MRPEALAELRYKSYVRDWNNPEPVERSETIQEQLIERSEIVSEPTKEANAIAEGDSPEGVCFGSFLKEPLKNKNKL